MSRNANTVDNTEMPFVPYLKDRRKPNATSPPDPDVPTGRTCSAVAEFFSECPADKHSALAKRHPYAEELKQFLPNRWQLEQRVPQMFMPVETTKVHWVETKAQLQQMVRKFVCVLNGWWGCRLYTIHYSLFTSQHVFNDAN